MRTYRKLLRYALRQWPRLLLIIGLTVLTSAVTVLQPWPLKLLVDYALGDVPMPSQLRALLEGIGISPTPVILVLLAALASLSLVVLNSGLETGLNWAWTATGQRMVYDLAADLFLRLQRLSPLFHSQRSVGDALSRLTGDTWCIYTIINGILLIPGQQMLIVVTIGFVSWHMNPLLAALSLAMAPVMAISAFLLGRRLTQWSRMRREAQSRIMSFVHQTLTAVPVVQAFTAEQRNGQQYRCLAREAVSVSQRGALVESTYDLVTGFATAFGMALVLFVGAQQVLAGALSVGDLIVFLAYLKPLQGAFKSLLKTYARLKSTEASTDRVLEVLEAEEGVQEAPNAHPLPSPVRGHLRLEHLTFGYEPGRPVLHDVSLEARPGETIALVGPTGAGKSTLAALLLRFFDPWQGRLTLDGTDLRQITLQSLRAHVALVLQEPFLLPLSISENIAYGRPSARAEEIEAAARAARAHEFIERLPQGYETLVGERGATLSGGQRQRLAIARALLKDAPVLVLDEPTSALDAQTEALLMEALERLMQGRTTVIIAHRLSTIRRADRIVVLEGGRVVEVGKHEELLARNGFYRQAFDLQHSRLPEVTP